MITIINRLQNSCREHLQISGRRIVILRKWRSAREMWTETISVLSSCIRFVLLPGLRCDALVKLDMGCIVFKGSMKL